ncbi:hypothetical protein AVEN_15543-1 [Araneus ventricosus]|uniref:OTU domain-containing protein n=1 Tax=Araneus ventricosus TaxID=182803 RepID=A0A4Y2Q6Y7_ARAVE|nr:hypothetical protein AVEN_15543-1 [Araneus ventricosus]
MQEKSFDPKSSITMASQKYCKIPIVGDGNCLFTTISFCIYESEDFHAEIREKVMQNISIRRGLLKDFAILKESVVYKEYEIHYVFMVCSTDFHAVFKTKKGSGGEPRSSEVAGAVLSKVGAGREPTRRAAS